MRDWSEVKEICEKATPGPWEDFKPKESNGFVQVKQGDLMVNTCYGLNADNDAELIALARTALPEAIAEIEQLRQDKAELESQVDALSTTVNMYVTPYYTMKQEKAELVELAQLFKGIIPENWQEHLINGYLFPGISESEVPALRKALAKLEGGEPSGL